ncbi:helix-turn-helix domain-containing protein [Acaryochloris sp. CCMEE 5410]|uniref:helix-turn-helix domain-containing protein n=1 Tax=Acaryochloris sp. CCMEE 5410 TaxID=310037 RepID=UPI0002483B68|nr:AraC family transcriptional regulator [Acaryochloris sp. CCMEE 5410]KAI9129989.1 helix-turn-helix transcriptional regulator [Acaryochloris sp. CCMEE 5410]
MLEGTCHQVDVTKPETMKAMVAAAPSFSNVFCPDALVPVDYYCQPAWETPSFYCQQHIITLCVGQSVQTYQITAEKGFQQAFCTRGTFGIYPAEQSQIVGWNERAEFIDLYLTPERIAHYVDPSLAFKRYELIPQFAVDDALIYNLGLTLKEQVEQDICNVFYIESALTMLIAHLLRYYSTHQKLICLAEYKLASVKLNQVIDYIHAHLERNPSLAELAALVDLSSCHFVKVFKQSTGTTPHQYLLRCRIEKAKQLLSQEKVPLAEIAQRVGFHDQSRFTSAFKKRVGVTPKKYRDHKI